MVGCWHAAKLPHARRLSPFVSPPEFVSIRCVRIELMTSRKKDTPPQTFIKASIFYDFGYGLRVSAFRLGEFEPALR